MAASSSIWSVISFWEKVWIESDILIGLYFTNAGSFDNRKRVDNRKQMEETVSDGRATFGEILRFSQGATVHAQQT